VKTGVQETYNWWKELDSGFRRNDGKNHFLTFYEFIKVGSMEFFSTLIKRPLGKLTISNYNGGLIRMLLD
jgi:hypothetical protein